jgi:hypothetical protein
VLVAGRRDSGAIPTRPLARTSSSAFRREVLRLR